MKKEKVFSFDSKQWYSKRCEEVEDFLMESLVEFSLLGKKSPNNVNITTGIKIFDYLINSSRKLNNQTLIIVGLCIHINPPDWSKDPNYIGIDIS